MALTGGDPDPRIMFEIRVVERGWYLHGLISAPGGQRTLADPGRLHPLRRWYPVAQSCDGRTDRAYVDGVTEDEAAVAFVLQGPGRCAWARG